ncbi:MAG TPA: YCF48-related protein [Candidatus Kapabacteria bacterium]|nr:YCF48-related protein [Candidatus Kapabacteria bacterium]
MTKRLTRILLIIGAVATCSTRVAAQYVLEKIGAGGHALRFVSPQEGYSIGDERISYTTDGGAHWTVATADAARVLGCEGVLGGAFVDRNTGWVIGHKLNSSDSTFLFRTTDGGTTWERQLASPIAAERYASHSFTAVNFVDRYNGWVVGKGIVERTTDGGVTWSTQIRWKEQQSNCDWLNCSFFRNVNEGWVGGYGSFILHTTDGGSTWETQHVDSAATNGIIDHVDHYYLHSIHFYDSLSGIAGTNNGNYLLTHDGGATWTSGKTGFPYDNVAGFMTGRADLWQVGGDYCDNTGCYSGKSILHSADGGERWQSLLDTTVGFTGLRTQYTGIAFVDPSIGYVSNESGEIVRIRDTSNHALSVQGPGASVLAPMVYPNPAGEHITIGFTDAAAQKWARIYDATGALVYSATFGNAERCEIGTAALRAGGYLLELQSGSTVTHRRIVVVH